MNNSNPLTNFLICMSCTAVAVVAVVLALRFIGPIPLSIAQTTTSKDSFFDVSGESEINVVPDEAQVSVGIQVTKPTVGEAQNEVNRVMNEMTKQIEALGIDKTKIKTTQYTVNPEFDYTTNGRRPIGFRVDSNVRVKIDKLELTNQVIDAATTAGANEVGGVSFTLSEEKEQEVKKQARKEAIEKAKENARELADLAGMRLGRITNIYEDDYSSPVYSRQYDMAEFGAADAKVANPTTINPGESSFTYSVTLSFETE